MRARSRRFRYSTCVHSPWRVYGRARVDIFCTDGQPSQQQPSSLHLHNGIRVAIQIKAGNTYPYRHELLYKACTTLLAMGISHNKIVIGDDSSGEFNTLKSFEEIFQNGTPILGVSEE
jgi:hypothetical protein